MIRNTELAIGSLFYPLGNTSPVCLTTDLPQGQNADILLLGCGDVRNVLFTCFADAGRNMDITCCDISPAIHARNIILYTLLIDDEQNRSIEQVWNIYYHLKLDEDSVKLLETQSQKLLDVSSSIDEWHGSIYGSTIRFCDERSLALVRSYWTAYQVRGLSDDAEKADRLKHMQSVLRLAKTRRKNGGHEGEFSFSDLRSTTPLRSGGIIKDLSAVSDQWWDSGTIAESNETIQKSTELNPTFLFIQNERATFHPCTSPLAGYPLGSAYVPIAEGSPFYPKNKGSSSIEHLRDSAKTHFRQWAQAFKTAVEKKIRIRIFCGDALAFGLTLRHCQLALPECSTSMNLFCDSFTSLPLKLHEKDYSQGENAAPSRFDAIDTSNLVDYLGPLNIVGIGSSLLKNNDFSSLYTEQLSQKGSNLKTLLSCFFGVDAALMALVFGLVLPELYTNAIDSFDNDLTVNRKLKLESNEQQKNTLRMRLRWKRLRGCQESKAPSVKIEAKEMAKLLIQLHAVMFNYEDLIPSLVSLAGADESQRIKDMANQTTLITQKFPPYNCLSFAFILSLLRSTVDTNWYECIETFCNSCFFSDSVSSIKKSFQQDMMLQLHMCGVYNCRSVKLTLADVSVTVLAPFLPLRKDEDVPEQLCVTVRVPRRKLKVFTEKTTDETKTPALTCIFEGKDQGGKHWLQIFSAVKVTFGVWHGERNQDNLNPFIKEDSSQLFGTSDMFISVYVSTRMLMQSKQSVPSVKCGLIRIPLNYLDFMEDLDQNLYLTTNKMTDKDVFVTRCMPGMTALPIYALDSAPKDELRSATTTLRLTQDGSKIDKLIQRISLQRPEAKAKLAVKSETEKVEFHSPLIAFFSFGHSEKLKFEFPIPVSIAKYKVRIARKSSYVEIESPMYNPLEEDDASFVCPTFLTKTINGETMPVPWTCTHINLDVMPPIDLKDTNTALSLFDHVYQTFSTRERRIRDESGIQIDNRIKVKDGLYKLLKAFAGKPGPDGTLIPMEVICLTKESCIQTLFFPSFLRFDLINRTIVLDAAMIPLTKTVCNDPQMNQLINEWGRPCTFIVSEAEYRVWKALMPVFVERCRRGATWQHTRNCEYVKTGEVPLSEGLRNNYISPICSCGRGKFPPDYLQSQMEKFPSLRYMVKNYATRVALAPIFAVPYVED